MLQIVTQGLIALEDVGKIKPGDKLDTMGVHGIAPFFAPIDLSKGGQVFVDETTGFVHLYIYSEIRIFHW